MSRSTDVAEFENMMCLDNPIKSTATRWERRANRTGSARKDGLDSSFTEINGNESRGNMDRFIPNRAGMDFDKTQIAEQQVHQMLSHH